ncbi:MAG: filamentous hemagglutinin N-terminal domain-containing protein [Pirellulaceae bacterium]
MFHAGVASANPFGGSVVAGSANISASGNTVTITQGTDRAVINWQGFSISPGELTQFLQPGANSAILNRVTGGNPSALLGTMQSNGQIFLINPNGILIGPNAHINVGGLTASTLDISNQQFMQGGDLVFSGNSNASVVNYGTVRALEGNIFLIGSSVENHGLLQARNGTVGLAAGQTVKLVDSARPHLVVTASSSSLSNVGVLNAGTIEAISAELAANGGNVYALAINNTGVVRATGSLTRNGRVLLTAPGGKIANSGDLIANNADGSGGEVRIDAVAGAASVGASHGGLANVSGRIDVSGVSGGSVQILGDVVSLTSASIDASGINGGGQVNIGGSYQGGLGAADALAASQLTTVDSTTTINADGALLGDGGRVIIWSDGHTDFAGGITARGGASGGDGGFVEVSGLQTLVFGDTGLVDTTAADGQTGMLLIDPGRVNIGTPTLGGFGALTIAGSTVRNNWRTTGVTISTATGTSGPEDINVWEALNPTFFDVVEVMSGNTFSLNAGRDINIFATIRNTGDGDFTFVAGRDVNFMAPLQSGRFVLGSPIGGGNIDITAGRHVTLAANPGDANSNFAPLAPRDVRVETFGDLTFDDVITVVAGADPDLGGNVRIFGAPGNVALLGSRFGDVDITANSAADGSRGNVLLQSRGGVAQIGFGRATPLDVGPIDADITIAADGRIDLTADGGAGAIAMIGHGGDGLSSAFNGDIDITRGERIRVQALSENSTAQIGHGGPNTEIFYVPLVSPPTGDITITVDRAQVFANGEGSTAMVGHGGNGGSGVAVGDISLTVADDLRLGTFDPTQPVPALADQQNATAQIGHGGRGFDASTNILETLFGDIEVIATNTDLTMEARGAGDVVQIGHGGFGAVGSVGDITVSVLEVELIASGAGSTDQIGHGGPLSSGNHVGNISVSATGVGMGTGFVRLEATGGAGGGAPVSTAQIGHGGALAEGTATGNIEVTAAGDHATFGGLFLFTENDSNVAQIGHGGEQYQGTLLLGDIDVIAAAGAGTMLAEGEQETVQIGHGGRNNAGAAAAGSITVDVALGLSLNADDDDGHVQIGHGGYQFVGTGGIVFDLLGDIDVLARGGDGLELISDDGDATAMIGHGGFDSVADSATSGDINVFSENDILLTALDNDSTSQIGHGGRESGSESMGRIDVVTNGGILLLADDGDTTAQIGHGGFQSAGEALGVIDIDAEGDIELVADSTDSTAQIGHGGFESSMQVEGDIFLTGAQLDLDADGFRSTAQLGHGGRGTTGSREGTIGLGVLEIELDADGTNSTAQIGHGGFDAEDDAEGAILLGSLDGVSLSTGLITANATAQIGHGGNGFDGNLAGPIILLSADNVTLTTLGLNGTTQIGHGGFGAASETIEGFIGLGALGNVFVTAGGINATAQIGHGGREFFGDTIDGDIVSANLGLLTLTTALSESTAQVGHGGFDAEVVTGIDGDIFLAALGANLLALGEDTTAQIGHGGSNFLGDSIVGDIGALEFGLVNLVAGPGEAAVAQFGHGGWGAETEIEGDIFLGALELNLLTISEEGTAQLGHGGTDFVGSAVGDIDVFTLGDVTLNALADFSTTQIGHGGAFAESLDPTGFEGDISVTSLFGGLTSTAAGEETVAQIGHGGFEAIGSMGDINVSMSFVELVASGFGSTDQIGHGGPLSMGDHSGDITVEATGTTAGDGFVSLLADGDGFATAQIGHGGSEAIGSAMGDITVIANGPDDAVFAIDLVTPADNSFAQIGHGGVLFNDDVMMPDVPGALSGAIDLSAPAGGLRALAGFDGAFVQVGHGGGASFADSLTGAITVNVLTDIIFTAGAGEFSYAQLGHGGALSSVLNPSGGAINVSANDLFFTAGADESSYVQLGHGGQEFEGDLDGAITVVANNINFTGGMGDENTYAQLGHGGNESVGDFTGDFMVTANDLTFLGGSVNDSYAQLGHGGDNADGDHGGNITVDASGNLIFTGGSGDDAYAQLGHGGVQFSGSLTGNIIVSGASLTLTGADDSAYARVGHGGEFGFFSSVFGGAIIDLTIDGPVVLLAPEEDSTAQIGHGGRATGFEIGGAITLRAQSLQMTSSGIDSTTQVGHVGHGAASLAKGDILLSILDAVSLHASAEDSTSQIGHGGRFSSLDAEGGIYLRSGSLALTADALESTAQIGHGGFRSIVQITSPSDIVAIVGSDVFVNSLGETSTAQIGHGGYRVGDFGEGFDVANLEGDIAVVSLSGSLSQMAANNQSTAQIGHGGRRAIADINGDILVAVASNLGITASGFESNGQIGHGGPEFLGEAEGDIYALAGDSLFLSASGNPSEARIGHGGAGHMPLGMGGVSLSGDIVVFSGKHMSLIADSLNRSQFGHGEIGGVNPGSPLFPVAGDIVAAWDIDSQLTGVDQGNRLFLGAGSVIGVGGDPANEVRLFGFRRGAVTAGGLAGPTNTYDTGAIVGGFTYNPALAPASLNGGGWRENVEFISWDHEQWGFNLPLDLSMPLLVDLTGLPYTGPFTFYYPGPDIPQTVPVFDIYWQYTAHGLFSETVMYMFPNNPYFSGYGPSPERPLGELAGDSRP